MVDWSIILCTNDHENGNGTGTGRRTVTLELTDDPINANPPTRGMLQEVSKADNKNWSSLASDLSKTNQIVENNGDNRKLSCVERKLYCWNGNRK